VPLRGEEHGVAFDFSDDGAGVPAIAELAAHFRIEGMVFHLPGREEVGL
jgi:hypothetical protein